jgi:hypothetical protein
MQIDHSYLLWVAMVAYAVHMMEETIYNWHDWVRTVFKLNAEWSEFYLVNAFVIVLGAGCAMVGWRIPAFALIFPAFMVVNALFFHIAPVIKTGIFSPGVITAVLLFLPVTAWVYIEAARDGVLNTQSVVISSILGFVLMLFPIVLQMTKSASFVTRYKIK